MRTHITRISALVALIAITVFGFAIHASALDDTYRFDSLGMSIKFPKSDNVITLDTPRGDEVFGAVGLDYDETMTAFKAADIYLRAYAPDNAYQISMTVTKDENTASVNNYADLTSADRKSILDTILADESVSSAVEVKRNGNIFFDSEQQRTVGDETVYINLSDTVVNGMQIDLMLQKSDEPITADEAKALSNAASSLGFDKIRRNTGPVFDWWRLLLWVVILAAISIAVTVIYRRYNTANKRKLEERRIRRAAHPLQDESDAEPAHTESEPMTFEESLGYKDDEEFNRRAEADEMAGYDINVRERDPAKGISYFEDEGSSIDDGTDYFDTYFEEPAEKHTKSQRFFSAIGTNIQIALKHTGYFFKNLFKKFIGLFKRR